MACILAVCGLTSVTSPCPVVPNACVVVIFSFISVCTACNACKFSFISTVEIFPRCLKKIHFCHYHFTTCCFLRNKFHTFSSQDTLSFINDNRMLIVVNHIYFLQNTRK